MAIIPIDDKWRIKSDERSWMVQYHQGWDAKKQRHIWKSQTYHANLGDAVSMALSRAVKCSDAETLHDLVRDHENACATLRAAVKNVFGEEYNSPERMAELLTRQVA